MEEAILRATDVAKSFVGQAGPVHALRGISLEVRRGEVVAIMGASGSGKSTLLHLLAGLDRPTAGAIVVEGHDLAQMSDHERTVFRRRRIGLIFQSYNLLPMLTALENVAIPSLLEGTNGREANDRARRLLERVNLTPRLHHRPQTLSGGEQQRVAIARALMMNPAIVLADEPTGNLDTYLAQDIWALLVSLARQENTTVVAVTHEAAGAAHADRIVFLKDGKQAGEMRTGGVRDATLVASCYTQLVG